MKLKEFGGEDKLALVKSSSDATLNRTDNVINTDRSDFASFKLSKGILIYNCI